MQEQIKRQVALKCSIAEIVNGVYTKEDGWKPNYIRAKNGKLISRANIIATVLSKNADINYTSVLIDDGSATIEVRSFDRNVNFDGLGIGDAILLIGRPREFSGTKYIIPEIMKKVQNSGWVKLRIRELAREDSHKTTYEQQESDPVFSEKINLEEIRDFVHGEHEDIISLIKKNDEGGGVEIEKITKLIGEVNSEKLISDLLKDGEIFEISPGRVKVLE